MKRTAAVYWKIRGHVRNFHDCVQYNLMAYHLESLACMVIVFLLLELNNAKFATGSYLYFMIIVVLRTSIVCVPYGMQMHI
jgi:hypothetical protein